MIYFDVGMVLWGDLPRYRYGAVGDLPRYRYGAVGDLPRYRYGAVGDLPRYRYGAVGDFLDIGMVLWGDLPRCRYGAVGRFISISTQYSVCIPGYLLVRAPATIHIFMFVFFAGPRHTPVGEASDPNKHATAPHRARLHQTLLPHASRQEFQLTLLRLIRGPADALPARPSQIPTNVQGSR